MSTSKAEASSPRLKLVIRRLPPTLPQEIFWKSVAPWVNDSTCTWKRFIKGRPSDGPYDHALHSRAYCLMSDIDALVNFHRSFAGHVFRSKTGAEYQAVVEFAPVQKTPLRTKAKTDARQGTIDEDPDFRSYLDSLSAPQPKAIIEPSLPSSQPTTTPLLEYLRTQGVKGKKKAKTESSSTDIARNAAAAVSASAARRNPKDQGGALVAGKGRAVVTPGASETQSNSKGKSRTKKSKGTAQAGPPSVPPPSITAKNFPALAAGLTASQPAPPVPPAQQTAPISTGRNTPNPGLSIRGRGRGRGTANGNGLSRGAEGDGGRGEDAGIAVNAGRGGGRGRGRGSGEGRTKNPREIVTGILTRGDTGDAGSTRGGRRGRGGTGVGVPDPRQARIDA